MFHFSPLTIIKPQVYKEQNYELWAWQFSPMQNTTYCVVDCKNKKAALIDSPWHLRALNAYLSDKGVTLTEVWLTHSHHDHTFLLADLAKSQSLSLRISTLEKKFWQSGHISTLQSPGYELSLFKGVITLEDGECFDFGTIQVKAHLLAGHTPGLMAYELTQDALVGDLLFIKGCGRTDLYGCGQCRESLKIKPSLGCGRCEQKSGDTALMFKSLQTAKLRWRGDLRIHSGHTYQGSSVMTMAEHQKTNPFLLCQSFKDFSRIRA